MRLYSGPLSLFSAKVRIALAEKGLAYERIEVAWSREHRYEPHHPDVVALNPKRQVPVLVDGDLVVYDSTQIFEYLEERAPEPPLYPAGIGERARCRRLEAFADEVLFPALWELIANGFYPAPRDGAAAARVEAAVRELRGRSADLDKELAGREYLCDRFGVADIASFIMLATAAVLGAPPDPGHANLSRWLARVGARPHVAAEMRAMQAYAAGLSGGRSGA